MILNMSESKSYREFHKDTDSEINSDSASDANEIVKITRVTRNFVRRKKTFAAVDNVSFSLKSGEFAAIVGKSGNGKTTFINIVAGLLKPSHGSVKICGCDISSANCTDDEISELRARNIGYVSQTHTLMPNLTVCANVMLPMYILEDFDKAGGDTGNKSDKSTENTTESYMDKVVALLKKLDIEDLLWCYPKELSGGEVKRVMIARAMMTNPKLLIFDEPTGDLDSEHTLVVIDMLRDAAAKGAAVLVVTHDNQVADCADRVYSMDSGVITFTPQSTIGNVAYF